MAWWIFQNVVVTAALAGIVAMMCRFGRIGPVGRHALWVLVLLTLYPLCRWVAGIKSRRRDWWLSYV